MTTSDGLSALAVVVSLVSAVATIATSRRQTRLQARLAAIEVERRDEELRSRDEAIVTANFVSEDDGRARLQILELKNAGPAVAHNVQFEIFESVPPGKALPSVYRGEEVLPIERMPPPQTLRLGVSAAINTAGWVRCRLSWEDGTGQREEILTLNVYA